MQVIEFLSKNTLEDLSSKYAIKAKRHGKYPNLVLLKYDQIESPMSEPIVRECRGLILDEADGWKVVSRPFDKFFNAEEGHAAKIDWREAYVYEKLDGSLMTLYWYDGAWQVASSGSPDASGPVNNDSSMTFADLFWKTWNDLGYRLPPAEDKRCYMFELMTPFNRVIVPHSVNRIVCLGERSVDHVCKAGLFYPEHNPSMTALLYGWEMAKHFPISSVEQALEAAKALNPMQQEGFVVVSESCADRMGSFDRVKVKSPQYVALHHMKDGFSDRRMIELVRANEGDEFLSYFPEFRELYEKYRGRFSTLVQALEDTYERVKSIESQKDFAIAIQAVKGKSALFAIRNKKAASIIDFLKDMSITSLEELLS